jgi:phosphatidylglycerophosphatase A
MTPKRDLGYWVAVGFGAGLFPIIAGTVGTIPLWLAAYLVAQWRPPSAIEMALASLLVTVIGFWAASRAEKVLGNHDPKCVVIDEWAGMLVALIGVPPDLKSYLWAFFFFRVYDVIKPPPARQAEHLPGGYGIVLDDVFAGFYSLITFHVLHHFLPAIF